MTRRAISVRSAFVVSVFAAAAAQAQTSGLVSVELTHVSASLAERLKIDEARIPMSMQVPPDVAAQVCGIAPGAPSPHTAPRGDGCMARQSTPELDKLLTARMKADDPATMGGSPAQRPEALTPSR
jgi:hypothetical protein